MMVLCKIIQEIYFCILFYLYFYGSLHAPLTSGFGYGRKLIVNNKIDGAFAKTITLVHHIVLTARQQERN